MHEIEEPIPPQDAAPDVAATPPDYRPPHRLELGYDRALNTRRGLSHAQTVRHVGLPNSVFVRHRARALWSREQGVSGRKRRRALSLLAWFALSLLGSFVLNGLRAASGDDARDHDDLHRRVQQRAFPMTTLAPRSMPPADAATSVVSYDAFDSGARSAAPGLDTASPGKASGARRCSDAVRALGLCAYDSGQAGRAPAP